jgi:hypothetical protein
MEITRKLPILIRSTRHNRPPGCARRQTESAGKKFLLSKKCTLDEGRVRPTLVAAEGSQWPFATAALLLKAPPTPKNGFFSPWCRLELLCCEKSLRRDNGKQPSVDA